MAREEVIDRACVLRSSGVVFRTQRMDEEIVRK
jgi:hypothetical protein